MWRCIFYPFCFHGYRGRGEAVHRVTGDEFHEEYIQPGSRDEEKTTAETGEKTTAIQKSRRGT